MKILPQLLLSAAVLVAVSSLQAEQVAQPVPASVNTEQEQTYGYLGLAIDVVPDSIRAHFPGDVASDKGLLVTRFADRSPAADDGIKIHDILIGYDDQPINDPEKFIKKVREDQPKRVVNFKLIRQGETLTVPVTMGEQKVTPIATPPVATAPVAVTPAVQAMPQQARQMPNMPAGMATNTAPPANYNGLAIRKIGEGVYEASIAFVGVDGTPQRRSYKGSHMQILQQVHNARDLSPAAKQQLLFALRPPKNKTQGMKGMNMPFGNGNSFNPSDMFKGWGW